MSARTMERRHIYGVAIALLGVVLTGVQISQGLQQTLRPIVFAFETLPFVLVAMTLVYVGYWLARAEDFESDAEWILVWGAGSILLFTSVAALLIFSQRVTVGSFEQAPYLAVNHITIGAVVGVVLGVYDARNRRQQRSLELERDRVETFARKAADVNNYGRALNRTTDIDEVSGLCIQGCQQLLGITETAVLRVAENEVTILDDTTVGVPEAVLGELAALAVDQEHGDVTVRDQPAVDGEFGEKRALTSVIDGQGGESVLLVGFASADTTLDTVDVELTELLVAHATTALQRLGNGDMET